MIKRVCMLVCVVAGLAACSEQPQTLGGSKQDAAAYSGTGKPYAEGNWKQGDKTSWESALRARTQNGQNDYTKSQ